MLKGIFFFILLPGNFLNADEPLPSAPRPRFDRSSVLQQSYLQQPIKVKTRSPSVPIFPIPISVWSPNFIAWHGSSAILLGLQKSNSPNTQLDDFIVVLPVAGLKIKF